MIAPTDGCGAVISMVGDGPRARCTLRSGLLQPRLIESSATSATVSLVATQALLLGGDHVVVTIDVGAGMLLEVLEATGTVAYNSGGVRSSWSVAARVASGGALLWHGEPFVVADGAAVTRVFDVDLEEGGVACLREVVVLGREGERGGSLRMTNDVRHAGAALLREDLDLSDPAERSAPGILGAARCLDFVSMLGLRPSTDGPDLRLDLEGPGALARHLGTAAHVSDMPAVWESWAGQVRAHHRREVALLGAKSSSAATTAIPRVASTA